MLEISRNFGWIKPGRFGGPDEATKRSTPGSMNLDEMFNFQRFRVVNTPHELRLWHVFISGVTEFNPIHCGSFYIDWLAIYIHVFGIGSIRKICPTRQVLEIVFEREGQTLVSSPRLPTEVFRWLVVLAVLSWNEDTGVFYNTRGRRRIFVKETVVSQDSARFVSRFVTHSCNM